MAGVAFAFPPNKRVEIRAEILTFLGFVFDLDLMSDIFPIPTLVAKNYSKAVGRYSGERFIFLIWK